ncbi:eukaryotic translation initiation factor 5A-2 [Xylariaceae sp. FL1019]|nr:eukaryotic translation initiation factor 5A-2 [Xylariaceae sp. FL1019]
MADDEHQHDFSSASADASATFPMQCSALRKNGFVCIKNRPCKIVDMSTSKTGKHGHAKVHLVGIDIFTAKKYEELCPSTHNMNVPNIKTTTHTVLMIEDDFMQLMDDKSGDITQHIKVPEGDLGNAIRSKVEEAEDGVEVHVTTKASMGEEHCVQLEGWNANNN